MSTTLLRYKSILSSSFHLYADASDQGFMDVSFCLWHTNFWNSFHDGGSLSMIPTTIRLSSIFMPLDLTSTTII